MKLGLFDLIGLAATLVFAIPLANYAVIQLLAGETALGAGLLVVAVAMVVLPQYFLDPGRILRGLLRGLLPRRLRGGATGSETDETAGSDGVDDPDETVSAAETDETDDANGAVETDEPIDAGGAAGTADGPPSDRRRGRSR
ncbi:hypothetical protein SAMN06264855_109112 [Halorubrum vacuolatum]|uniref:Uncharacterized protein n=1 Tax=Halorubrum vacuolatum TaxID=63740 RepID=A0A238WRG2_HALVU|nr:hypothetical protein SAMN06264855_109112 [Halorubrum vacuolatum]